MRFLCALISVLVFSTCSNAVNVGDEIFATSTEGNFYVFADKAIHVINPSNRSVIANITADQSGNALTGSNSSLSRVWNDAIYIQKPSLGAQMVFVNEGDAYTETNGSTYGYTTVINTITRSIIGRAKVGPRSVHIYAINRTSTVWVHSDGDGYFYLLDVQSLNPFQTRVTSVKAFDNVPGHGKLIVNDALYPIAYGTNVAENVITKFDVSNNTRIGSYNFTSALRDRTCFGTHSAWYSRVNQHIYFECATSGIFEWNTVNDTLVAQHNINGTITATPGDDRIFVTLTADRISTIVDPRGNGQPSQIEKVITVSSQPGDPAFYSNSSSSAPRPYNEYTAFFPTARNTNLNNIKAVGNANVQTRDYYAKPSDCTYDSASTVSASSVSSSRTGTGLQLAAGSNQSCGACAAGIANMDPSQFNATLAGFRIYDLAGTQDTAILESAGAVSPMASASTSANQCSFASPSRVAKRGGAYVATVADYPQASIYLILGNTPFAGSSEYFVRTASRPRKIVWVPSTIRPTG